MGIIFQEIYFPLEVHPWGKDFLANALSHKSQYNSVKEEVIQALILVRAAKPMIGLLTAVTYSKHLKENLPWVIKDALIIDPWFLGNQTWLTRREGFMWKG